MKYLYQRKPRKCPRCGSNQVVKIMHGFLSSEVKHEEDDGEIILGGCSGGNDDPNWQCNSCKTTIHKIKLKRVKAISYKDGEPVFNLASTLANDDWLHAARLKKKADEGDDVARKELERMENTKMFTIE